MSGIVGDAHPDGSTYTVSCNVYRDATLAEVLLGVRRPTPTSGRHPGVLSTLTMRLPRELFELVAGPHIEKLTETGSGGIIGITGERGVAIGGGASLGYADTFVVESLLARKLGLADSLVLGRIQGLAKPVTIAVDDVDDPLGTGLTEHTYMISYSLLLTAGADLLPTETTSYSRLIWAPTRLLGQAVASRDALILDETLDPIEVCIHGLCVRSAAYQLEQAGISG